jgi:pimeloyl-ACP methyl ester carboxylesterase
MPNTKTVQVPHLGGITASYQQPHPYDPSKPTLILVNSFTTSSELYRSQYANEKLTDALNLISIELLGHGQTRTKSENFTYWDTAIMNLQVIDALGITGKIFVLGTGVLSGVLLVDSRQLLLKFPSSLRNHADMNARYVPGRLDHGANGTTCPGQGMFPAPTRLVLSCNAPAKGKLEIAGIIPLGTSLDNENPRTVSLGCWDGPALLSESIQTWTSYEKTPDFEPTTEYCDFLIDIGFGKDVDKDTRKFWQDTIKSNYQGDEGRRRIRMAAINLAERDGLHSRLSDVHCPVLWLHGTEDAVYSVANAEVEIKKFVNSPDARLQVVQGGQHFLSFSNPDVVDGALIEFAKKYGK